MVLRHVRKDGAAQGRKQAVPPRQATATKLERHERLGTEQNVLDNRRMAVSQEITAEAHGPPRGRARERTVHSTSPPGAAPRRESPCRSLPLLPRAITRPPA